MKDSILHIRINAELKQEAIAKAKQENRTLSNLIEKLIKDYLKK
jgi:predicted HicB family RNase H-like nuclease